MKSRKKRINNKGNYRASVSCGKAASSLLIGVPRGEGDGWGKKQRTEKICTYLKKLLSFFSSLMNTINTQTQESQQTPSRKSIKRNHINAHLIKLLKASDEEKRQ